MMKMSQRPQHGMSPDQLSDLRDRRVEDAAALVAAWEGKFDARIAELRVARAALDARVKVEDLATTSASLTSEVAGLKAERDALLVAIANARDASAIAEKEAQERLERANAGVVIAETRRAEIVADAERSAEQIKSRAHSEAEAIRQTIADAEAQLARVRADVGEAEKNLLSFRDRLVEEKAEAARRLGVG